MKKDAKSYQALYELAELARQDERLRLALQAAKNGEPAEPAFVTLFVEFPAS